VSNYFDNYSKRVRTTGGDQIGDAVKSSTIDAVNNAFEESPSYTEVILNDTGMGARVTLSKDSKEIEILYRPLTRSFAGDLIIYNNEKWIVFESKNHEVYPKATAKFCSESLKWNHPTAGVQEFFSYVTTGGTAFGIYDADRIEMNSPIGELRAYVQYNIYTKDIVETQRFLLGNQAYEVKGIDDITGVINGYGLIRFSLRVTTKRVTDDFDFGIADNSHLLQGGSSGGSSGSGSGGTSGGGGLW
jgi:uncharacterized membrane protein YgcG